MLAAVAIAAAMKSGAMRNGEISGDGYAGVAYCAAGSMETRRWRGCPRKSGIMRRTAIYRERALELNKAGRAANGETV